jgi:AcrR family transcriptional regulator
MSRTVKVEEYTGKRNEILKVAQSLVYTKGYEQLSIQDILDGLKISKGAFYHYFPSKSALLEALVERMVVEQLEPLLLSVVQDPHLTALEKLQRYFDKAVAWKTASKDLMLGLVKVWYSDDNALARQKMLATMTKLITPLFMQIIDQGVREGVFTASYPEYFSYLIISLSQPLGDAFIQLLTEDELEHKPDVLQRAETLVLAYNDAVERVLGAPAGSIHMMDIEMLKEWFSPEESPAFQAPRPLEEIGIPGSRNP